METELSSYNRATVNLSAIKHNYKLLASVLPDEGQLLAMVKGDGYGHGMIETAFACHDAGCRLFGVAELCEGVKLRQSGITGEIFVMVGFAAEQADYFFSHSLTPVVFDKDLIAKLSEVAVAKATEITVHLKVDCGMSRLGVKPEEVDEFVVLVGELPGLRLGGILSHFAAADDASSPLTDRMFAVFQKVCDRVGDEMTFHIANSGGIINYPQTHGNMARAGISLYGYPPSGEQEQTVVGEGRLTPAMTFSTRVVMVKTVEKGAGISYGHTFTTTRETRLAVLPVGYEDGYPRSLSNRGTVLLHGKRAPILGRVCMNLTMVDVTDIEGVEIGDEAVLMGNQGDETITADDIAALTDTISYEILCMLGNNNERVFVE